ncbi:MAG: protein phosphatase 2C domain-containing protein [Roseiarcus sp.]|uniref:PP2C family protein-serine/threonine phosphatase n=1 Tax=Roseiarcus sp. TaxID=1969460 RepID=UPI003C5E8DC1
MIQKHLLRWLGQNRSTRAVRSFDEAGAILASDRGLKRDDNQDRLAAMRYNGKGAAFVCFAVADGMGGLRDGAECAEITIAAFFDALISTATKPPWDRLDHAARHANSEVHLSKGGSGGSTLSAILVESEREIYSANIGDSRIYVEQGTKDNKLSRVTVDDSLEEAFGGQGRELLQFVGIGKGLKPHISRIDPSVRSIAITTDGIHFLGSSLLETIYLRAPDRRSAADRLLALSRWFGGPDNASIAIVNPSVVTRISDDIDNNYAEFWGIIDTMSILLGSQTQGIVSSDEAMSNKDVQKNRGGRRQKRTKTPSNVKPEQLKIDIELKEKNTDGSNS